MMKRAKDRHHDDGGEFRRRRTKDGPIMKRTILAVGLCCLGLFASDSQAFFGLLSPYNPRSLWHPHNRYVTHITCRPYNAFTPICWGNLVCDGCCPNPCGVAGGCLPMQFGMPPFASMGCGMQCMGPSCGPAYGMQHGYAGDMPPMNAMPQPPMPDMRSMPFTPPPPMPMPTGPGTTMAYPYNNVSQANYYQYVPQYYPNYYTPNFYQPAPYYWYGYGR
jgi:hypothetical protein